MLNSPSLDVLTKSFMGHFVQYSRASLLTTQHTQIWNNTQKNSANVGDDSSKTPFAHMLRKDTGFQTVEMLRSRDLSHDRLSDSKMKSLLNVVSKYQQRKAALKPKISDEDEDQRVLAI